MKIASHNTMSYLKPRKWYMNFVRFVGTCQDKTIQEQYELGVRAFDIRIKIINGQCYFGHGLITYKGISVEEVLKYLNDKKDCYVRLILEESKYNNHTTYNTYVFKFKIGEWLEKYPNIYFFEGRRKYDWCKIAELRPDINYIQRVSSMNGNEIDDCWPRLYAIRHNKENVKVANNSTDKDVYMFIDFVGKYY